MAKKPTRILPSSKFDIALAAGSVEPAMKAAEAKSTKLYKVPVSKIETMPGFNVRVQSADYLAHRDMIAESIRLNGYDQTKPLSGYVHKAESGNVIYVTDGHTRLDAVNKLNAEEGFEPKIDMIPILVHAGTVSLTDLTVALHTSNNGRPLTPFELGVVVKRLLKDEGADKATIAGRLSVTPRYLDDVLLLVNGPKAVREAVLDGTVSSTLAIQELRKAGDKPEAAAEKIAAAVAKATPGKKVTKKALGPKMKKVKGTVSIAAGTDMKEIVKAVAQQVRAAIAIVPHATDPEAKVADVDGTITITIEVPDTDEPKPAKVAKPAKKPAAAKKPAKPAKAEPAAEPEKAAAKPKAGKKPAAAKPAPAPAPEPEDDDITAEDDEDEIVEGAEEVTSDGEDDELAQPAIAVKNGEGVGDDVDI